MFLLCLTALSVGLLIGIRRLAMVGDGRRVETVAPRRASIGWSP